MKLGLVALQDEATFTDMALARTGSRQCGPELTWAAEQATTGCRSKYAESAHSECAAERNEPPATVSNALP
jgi:hypothetical protein